jgi:hypothetical protein
MMIARNREEIEEERKNVSRGKGFEYSENEKKVGRVIKQERIVRKQTPYHNDLSFFKTNARGGVINSTKAENDPNFQFFSPRNFSNNAPQNEIIKKPARTTKGMGKVQITSISHSNSPNFEENYDSSYKFYRVGVARLASIGAVSAKYSASFKTIKKLTPNRISYGVKFDEEKNEVKMSNSLKRYDAKKPMRILRKKSPGQGIGKAFQMLDARKVRIKDENEGGGENEEKSREVVEKLLRKAKMGVVTNQLKIEEIVLKLSKLALSV